jgi:hypothetical protein
VSSAPGLVRSSLGFALRVIVVLVVLEAAARLLEATGLVSLPAPQPVAERAHTTWDPEIGWVGRPNVAEPDFYGPGASLHTDSRGFRGEREIAREVPAGRARVLCSGDSFALGYGVDDAETWCRRLEGFDARVETVNLGQGGYGIDQSFLWWRRAAADLEYHAHVFTFIVEDFARMEATDFLGYGKPRLALRRGELVVENVPVPRAPYLWPWLTRHGGLAGRLRSVALLRRLVGGGGGARGPSSFVLERSLPVSVAVFDAVARAEAEAGRSLVLVYLPTREEHGDDRTAELRAFLASEARRRGWTFLDLVEDLRGVPADAVDALFIPEGAIDFAAAAGHYTPEGNRRVAEWIYARAGGSLTRALRGR